MIYKNIKYTVFSICFLLISNLVSAHLEQVRGVWINMKFINYLQKHNNQYSYEAEKNIVINSLSFNQKTNTINISTFGSELFPYKYKYNSITKEYTIEKIYLYDKFYDKKGKIIYGHCSIKLDNKKIGKSILFKQRRNQS